LAEASFAKRLQYFISIGQMVSHDHTIVSSFIIKAIIVGEERRTFDLLSIKT